MTEQATTTEQMTTIGQGMTSDVGTMLPDESRVRLWEVEKSLYRIGRDDTTADGRTLSTDGQSLVTDEPAREVIAEQTTETGMDGQMTIMGTDERLTTTVVEELVVEVDPLMLSPTSPAVDPLALSPASSGMDICGEPMVTHDLMEDTLIASPVEEVQEADVGCDMDSEESLGGKGKRVVGRSQAIVIDEDSDTSVVSISSGDEDHSMAGSSSRSGRGKGKKRKLKPAKKKEKVGEKGGNEERRGRKKGKEKEDRRKETPEEEEEEGKYGEPKGIVDPDLENMSSEVLGGAIQDWADSIENIRSKSKNIQGRLSGTMKKSVAQIKEGTALLVARSTASGDPEFLRMRNTELVAELREARSEIARLREQLKKSPEVPSPPRKKKRERVLRDDVEDAVSADFADSVDLPSTKEAFPPLPQRAPRDGVAQDGGVKKKVGPRVVSDIQVAPPFRDHRKEEVAIPAVPGLEAEWRVAAGSRRRGRVKGDLPPPPPPVPAEGRPPPLASQQRPRPKVRLPRPPLSSAVTITGKTEGFSYAEALRRARENISLENLGISTSRVRKALNGGLLIEVSGEDSRVKAEELVTQLRSLLKDTAAISCPVKKRELTVVGFDESVTTEDIAEALSRIGSCPREDIKLGPIRTINNGLGMVWVQLPVAAAAKAAEEGRIRVGWTSARVELLKVRPLQCYRCWSFGHVQTSCRSVVDRRGACFRCGQKGHVAGTCTNPVHCAVCHDLGFEASHRLGGPQCAAQERQDLKKK